MLKGLIEGRMVHYVLSTVDVPAEFQHCVGRHRPAVVVNAWDQLARDDGYANLTVFVDWSNDGNFNGANKSKATLWATSRLYSEGMEPGTWHWIEGSIQTANTKDPGYVKLEDFDVIVERAISRMVKPGSIK